MKKLLLATAICLTALPVFADGLDGMDEEYASAVVGAGAGAGVGASARRARNTQTYQRAETISESKSRSVRGTSKQAVADSEASAFIAPYVALKASWVYLDSDVNVHNSFGGAQEALNDKLFGLSAAVGVKISNFRTELEYNYYQDAKDDINSPWPVSGAMDIKLKQQTVFLNGYYDIDFGSNFVPYVGAGIGVAKLKAESPVVLSDKNTNFAWQVGLGASYAITDNWSLDAGYRYVDMGDLKYDVDVVSAKNKDIIDNQVYAGVRFTF